MRWILLLSVWLSGTALAGAAEPRLEDDALARRALLPLLQSGQPVELMRVENKPGPDRSEGVLGYRILGTPVRLQPGQVQKLASLLAVEAQFAPYRRSSACGFFPGYAVRVGSDGDRGNLLICFRCNEIMVEAGDRTGYEYSCKAQQALSGFVREVLPEDAALRELNLNRECY